MFDKEQTGRNLKTYNIVLEQVFFLAREEPSITSRRQYSFFTTDGHGNKCRKHGKFTLVDLPIAKPVSYYVLSQFSTERWLSGRK